MLYYLDQLAANVKKYRIPAHENPFFEKKHNIELIKRYGGEFSDEYIHLVLGGHGEPVFSVIPFNKIRKEPFDFYNQRYTQEDKHSGVSYENKLELHDLNKELSLHGLHAAIDTGYTDPTIITILGKGKDHLWRCLARFRIVKIDFIEQADIIDWLDKKYNFNQISIDISPGGGGMGIMQDLKSKRFPRNNIYFHKIFGVHFSEKIERGEDNEGNPVKSNAKSVAGEEISRLITEGNLVFSEIDGEAMDELSRLSFQNLSSGDKKFFIISPTGRGKSGEDHITASFMVFSLALLAGDTDRMTRKLFVASWSQKQEYTV